jgi:hypothetical protein
MGALAPVRDRGAREQRDESDQRQERKNKLAGAVWTMSGLVGPAPDQTGRKPMMKRGLQKKVHHAARAYRAAGMSQADGGGRDQESPEQVNEGSALHVPLKGEDGWVRRRSGNVRRNENWRYKRDVRQDAKKPGPVVGDNFIPVEKPADFVIRLRAARAPLSLRNPLAPANDAFNRGHGSYRDKRLGRSMDKSFEHRLSRRLGFKAAQQTIPAAWSRVWESWNGNKHHARHAADLPTFPPQAAFAARSDRRSHQPG